jgi:hypothetical protein
MCLASTGNYDCLSVLTIITSGMPKTYTPARVYSAYLNVIVLATVVTFSLFMFSSFTDFSVNYDTHDPVHHGIYHPRFVTEDQPFV